MGFGVMVMRDIVNVLHKILYFLYYKIPVYEYDCGSINERIQSCDNLKTQLTMGRARSKIV